VTRTIDLAGRRALVCGASSGIGRATAVALAQAGAAVTVLARSRDKLAALADELRAAGAPTAYAVPADMDDLAAFTAAVREHVRAHGGVHICVHNTGGPKSLPLLETTEDDLRQAFTRHQLTAHVLVRELQGFMTTAGYGRFVQVLSTAAREPIVGLGLSNTVRAGMLGWAKTLAKELPPHVTINNVLPGYTATERLEVLSQAMAARKGVSRVAIIDGWVAGIPEGRLGQPQEIAAAVVFLASPLAAYIRGQSLAVDGGRLQGL
jgi:3-oxoacyl-[acyl-carrier protein] reductase